MALVAKSFNYTTQQVDQAALMNAIPQIFPTILIGLVICIIVALITGLLATIGIIRFARTGSMGEAFNFGAILETIRKIGWLNYILALLLLFIVQVIIVCLFSVFINLYLPLGFLIEFVFVAPVGLFECRYLCNLYDSAKA
jgi:hypothetical protein